MEQFQLIQTSQDLETAGLVWQPEIGDEIAARKVPERVSILVDPQGLTPNELRSAYIWLPTTEQLVLQLELRQAILFHAGLELGDTLMCYKTIIQSPAGKIEGEGNSLRLSIANCLRDFLLADSSDQLH